MQTIDIGKYSDRVNNIYIFYNVSDFQQAEPKSENIDSAKTYFANHFIQGTNKLRSRANALQAQAVKANSTFLQPNDKITSALVYHEDIAGGGELEKILESCATQMSKYLLNQKNVQLFDSQLKETVSYYDLLQSKDVDEKKVDDFFTLLNNALDLRKRGTTSNKTYQQNMRIIKKRFLGQQLEANEVLILDDKSLGDLNDIVRYLNNAANKLQTNGTVSSESFGSTIRQIFSKKIGETIPVNFLRKSMNKMDKDVDKSFSNISARKLGKGASGDTTFYSPKREGEVQEHVKSKVDIMNTDGLKFTVDIEENGNKTTCLLTTSTNFSVKNYANDGTDLHIVGGTPLSKYLTDNQQKYFAYNIMIHRKTLKEEYELLKASLAANYIETWLMGSGFTSGADIDLAQFMYYNGKVYSMLSIIYNIVSQYQNNIRENEEVVLSNSPLSLEFKNLSKIKNDWIGEKGNINEDQAKTRSNQIRDALNAIELQGKINNSTVLNSAKFFS